MKLTLTDKDGLVLDQWDIEDESSIEVFESLLKASWALGHSTTNLLDAAVRSACEKLED